MRHLIFAVNLLAFFAAGAGARTWTVDPDGSGDATTIQGGLDLAQPGDVVEVVCGTYVEHDILMKSGVILRSQSGEFDCVTVDAAQQGRVFYCQGLDSGTEVRGFTITGGWTNQIGAGMYVTSDSDFTVSHCRFSGNSGTNSGGLACVLNSDPLVEYCLFSQNWANDYGGAAACVNASPLFVNCTFADNQAYYGGGLYCHNGAAPTLENCLLAYNNQAVTATPVYCEVGSSATLTGCVVYGVDPTDWTGCLAEQLGVNGNFRAEPGFCDAEGGDFHLCGDSWCLPGTVPGGGPHGLIGALGAGCAGCGPHLPAVGGSWGSVKVRYR